MRDVGTTALNPHPGPLPEGEGEHVSNMGFSAIDYAVLLLYLAGITIFGVMFRKSQRTVKDYFLGDRNTSWVVISLSIVATETSTLTLIGVPALAYSTFARPEQGGSLTYLQVVLGYIVADGCFTSDRLCIADKDKANADLYAAKFETAFRRRARVLKGPHENFEVTCHSLPLGRFLRRLLGPGVVRSRERQVPTFVFDLPAEERAAFLRGYFDGEGWVAEHQVSATSASLYLIVGVQWLLASLGIDSHISPTHSATGSGKGRSYCTLSLTDTARFSQLVGFCAPAKRTRLGPGQRPKWSTTSYLPENAVHPVLERICESSVMDGRSGHQTVYDIPAGRVKPNVGSIRRIAQDRVRPFRDGGIGWIQKSV